VTASNRGRHGPNRNGARHCCQAPLRRAKDLPVFATLISQPEGPKIRPRSWLTSSGVVSHRGGPKTRFLVRFGSRKSFASQFPSAWPEGVRDLDVPRPFLGRVPSTQLCLPGGETALVQGSTNSSGASCRLVRKSIRCVIAPKGSSASNLIPSPAGGDRYFRHSPRRLAVAGLLVRRGLPSRSQLEPAQRLRVAPSGIFGLKPVDNGDIAHNSC
jgi:hypothetical protein